jgi:uncharacterized repeat protein (TIGR02543 family)
MGYEFSGWFEDNGTFTREWNFNTVPERNLTLYARWAGEVAVTVTGPVTGDIPVTTAQAGGAGYTCGPVTWTPAHNPFQGNTQYTAAVTLTAVSGYTFDVPASATMNGNPALITANTATSVTLEYTFAPTGSKAVTAIAVSAQPAKTAYVHGEALDLSGLEVTITYTDGTTEPVPFSSTNFASKNISASPAHGDILSRSSHDGQPVVVSLGSHQANTAALTVAKKTGALVTTPTVSGYPTHNSITVNAVTAPANGQTVEYAVSTASGVTPTTGWQTGTTFTGLAAGTTYYVYARSKEEATYYAGTASVSAKIITGFLITNAAEWAAAVSAINANSTAADYTFVIGGSFTIPSVSGDTFTPAHTLTITTNGTTSRAIALGSAGNILRIGANQTVIIDSPTLTLQGITNNDSSLVYFSGANAKLELKNGTLTSNILVSAMNPWSSGGVHIDNGGTFTMSGGVISGNNVIVTGSGYDAWGGGVYVHSGIFKMTGGTIAGNMSIAQSGIAYGGGVYIQNGATFQFASGTIYGNSAGSNSNAIQGNSSSTGASLYVNGGATAQRGTFSGSVFTPTGTLSTTDNTVQ